MEPKSIIQPSSAGLHKREVAQQPAASIPSVSGEFPSKALKPQRPPRSFVNALMQRSSNGAVFALGFFLIAVFGTLLITSSNKKLPSFPTSTLLREELEHDISGVEILQRIGGRRIGGGQSFVVPEAIEPADVEYPNGTSLRNRNTMFTFVESFSIESVVAATERVNHERHGAEARAAKDSDKGIASLPNGLRFANDSLASVVLTVCSPSNPEGGPGTPSTLRNVNGTKTKIAGRSKQLNGIFERSRAVDSVVLVSFDVFPATDTSESTLFLKASVEAGNITLREAASIVLLDAYLQRPSTQSAQVCPSTLGRHALREPHRENEHAAQAVGKYFDFFDERNVSFRVPNSGIEDRGTTLTSSICSVEEQGEGTPLLMDVVYTYVNEKAPSHEAFKRKFPEVFRSGQQRYRDWNEILYSLRSVFHYGGLCDNKTNADDPHVMRRCADASGQSRTPLVRRVHIVVADKDQAPEWLDVHHPQLRIVDHREIFDTSEHFKLPTFNSHAIESALHRIPGLSRYFVYFNNDMFFGRRLSFFDYFRPLSIAREELRSLYFYPRHPASSSRRSAGEQCDTDVLWDSSLARHRVTVMFEPIYYFEREEGRGDMIIQRRDAEGSHNATGNYAADAAGRPEDDSKGHRRCVANMSAPISVQKSFKLLFKTPISTRRRVTNTERWRQFANNNRNFLFERLGIGAWPSHSFAHYPRIMDRDLLTEMNEIEFRDIVEATRAHRTRKTVSFWTTMACQYYALAQRKVVDWELMLAAASADDVHQAFPGEGVMASTLTFLSWPLRPPSIDPSIDHLSSLLSRYWHEAKENTRPTPSLMFSADVSSVLSKLNVPSTYGGEMNWFKQIVGLFNVAPHLKERLTKPQPSAAALARNLWTELCQGRFGALFSNISAATTSFADRLQMRRNAAGRIVRPPFHQQQENIKTGWNSKARRLMSVENLKSEFESDTAYGFRQDCASISPPAQIHRSQAARRVVRDASIPLTMDEEKIDFHAARLDRKSGMYHFCIINSAAAARRYLRELSEGNVKLFVTVNDDLRGFVQDYTVTMVMDLLKRATGDLPPAKWEKGDNAR